MQNSKIFKKCGIQFSACSFPCLNMFKPSPPFPLQDLGVTVTFKVKIIRIAKAATINKSSMTGLRSHPQKLINYTENSYVHTHLIPCSLPCYFISGVIFQEYSGFVQLFPIKLIFFREHLQFQLVLLEL